MHSDERDAETPRKLEKAVRQEMEQSLMNLENVRERCALEKQMVSYR